MRPPTCSGQPALGMIEKRPSGTSSRIIFKMRRSWLGPPEQFTPITSAPVSLIKRATFWGLSPSRVRSSRVKVMEATTGMDGFTWRAAMDRFIDFKQVGHGFDDEQIDAAVDQGLNLLAECLARLVRLHPAKWRQAYSKRSNIPCDQYWLKGSQNYASGKFSGRQVNIGYPGLQPMAAQFITGWLQRCWSGSCLPRLQCIHGELQPPGRGRSDSSCRSIDRWKHHENAERFPWPHRRVKVFDW